METMMSRNMKQLPGGMNSFRIYINYTIYGKQVRMSQGFLCINHGSCTHANDNNTYRLIH